MRATLRLRLALCYGAMTAAVLVLACAYGYAVHSRTHYAQVDATLRNVAGHLAMELDGARTAAARDAVLATAPHFGLAVTLVEPRAGYVGGSGVGGTPGPFAGAWAPSAGPASAEPRIAALAPDAHLDAPVSHHTGGMLTVLRGRAGERWPHVRR